TADMPSRLTQNRFGTSVALMSVILALMPAVLKCFSKVETRRCWALRSVRVEASPVAGALAVNSCFLSLLVELEHAVRPKPAASVQAIKIFERANVIKNPFLLGLKTEHLHNKKKYPHVKLLSLFHPD